MTDHQKLLVAALSEPADADVSVDGDDRRPSAPELMALLYRLGRDQRRPVVPATA